LVPVGRLLVLVPLPLRLGVAVTDRVGLAVCDSEHDTDRRGVPVGLQVGVFDTEWLTVRVGL